MQAGDSLTLAREVCVHPQLDLSDQCDLCDQCGSHPLQGLVRLAPAQSSKGRITLPLKLVSYVYEPLQQRSGNVAIVLHGSTSGMAPSPEEPLNLRGFSIGFLLGRGMFLSSGLLLAA
ncbi:MAG TPA: hypothetical protein VJL86_00500 [Steroidobacteraceae bacterium]|nr:hypothetical protein [Steroidobacteraceae bacterium]